MPLVAIVANGLIDFRLSQNHLQAQTLENIVLMADMQEGQVLGWMEDIKGRTVNFASDGLINNSLKMILSGDKQAVNDLNRHLLENKLPVDPMIFGIHVMDLNGKVVASSRGSEVGGEDMAMDEVFLQARGSRAATAYLSDIAEAVHFGEENIAILATAPIIDHDRFESAGDQERSENLGVIMLFFKTQGLNDILTGKAQTASGALSTWTRKKTLEMYLVNGDGLMITESKFIVNAPLKQKADTVPVHLCKHYEEMSGKYPDYRGIPVFGASMCFGNGWTLLAEIDEAEVLGALDDYLQQNLLSAGAIFLLILFVMYLFILGITSPLQELSQAAQKIGKGDFTARAKLITRDEFGQLSGIFNQMAESIQKSSVGLQQKVKEEEMSWLAMSNILGDLDLAKNQLEQAKAKDEAILSSIGDAVMACDKDGRVMLFNGVACALTGFSIQEVIGQHYDRFLKFIKESDGKPGNDFISDAIKIGQQTKMANHTLLITKDGQKIPVADSAAPVKDGKGEIIGCVVVFRDVTHEREIDRAKTEFVSLASHQLRTPLTGIEWTIELFSKKEKLTEDGKKYLDDIHFSAKRLSNLVKLLLNVSRIESGRVGVTPKLLDLVELINGYAREYQMLCDKKQLVLVFEKHPKKLAATSDKDLLGYIVQNLLGNAIEYTPIGGKIEVSLEAKENSAIFAVRDTGIGIPKELDKRIFEKFFRAPNAVAAKPDGSGLGLYIVAESAKLLGGKIWFESEEGKGSTFYVELPLVSQVRVGEKGLVDPVRNKPPQNG